MADQPKRPSDPPEDQLHPAEREYQRTKREQLKREIDSLAPSILDSTNADLLRLHREHQEKLVAVRTATEMARASAAVGQIALHFQNLAFSAEHQKAIQLLGAFIATRAREESVKAGNILAMAGQLVRKLDSPEMRQSLENMQRLAGIVRVLAQPPSPEIAKPLPVGPKPKKETEPPQQEQGDTLHQVIAEAVRAGLKQFMQEFWEQEAARKGELDSVTPVELGPASSEIRADEHSDKEVADDLHRKITPRHYPPPPSDPSPQPPTPIQRKVKAPIGSLAIGLAVLERALDVIGFHNLIVGALLFVVAFACIVIWFIQLEQARQWRFGKRAAVVGIGGAIYFVLVGYQLLKQYRLEKAPQESKPQIVNVIPSPSPLPSPKTLHDYFAEEGGNCWRETIPQQIRVKNESVEIEAQMCMNFNNKAQHLAFYVPYTHYTAEVCSRLIGDHRATLRDFIKRYQGTMEVGPIEGRQTQVKDLRFTKYILVFHEAPITQDKLDWLDLQAKQNGLIVEYHSQKYVMARMR